MKLEIVTPEQTLFTGDVTSVAVPGVEGAFQMLDNHAPIVSLLVEGTVRIKGNMTLPEKVAPLFTKAPDGSTELHIKGGVLEMSDNHAIILAD